MYRICRGNEEDGQIIIANPKATIMENEPLKLRESLKYRKESTGNTNVKELLSNPKYRVDRKAKQTIANQRAKY